MLFQNKQVKCVTLVDVSKFLSVILVGVLVTLGSCTKENVKDPTKVPKQSFFRNADDAFVKVQNKIYRFNSKEKLIVIDRISYINGPDKNYAFVFYHSNLGQGSLSIEKNFEEDFEDGEGGWTSYRCEGSCDCNVLAVIGAGGKITIKCSCGACDRVSH